MVYLESDTACRLLGATCKTPLARPVSRPHRRRPLRRRKWAVQLTGKWRGRHKPERTSRRCVDDVLLYCQLARDLRPPVVLRTVFHSVPAATRVVAVHRGAVLPAVAARDRVSPEAESEAVEVHRLKPLRRRGTGFRNGFGAVVPTGHRSFSDLF